MGLILRGNGVVEGLTDLPAGSVTAADLESTLDLSGKTVTLPLGTGGKILQIVQDTKTDTFSTTSTSFVDVTGLSVSITPSSTSSKILVLGTLQWNTTGHASARLLRDSTNIAIGDSAGSRIQGVFHNSDSASYNIIASHIAWLDSPATTSAVTYKFQIAVPWSSTYVVTVNRSTQDTDTAYQSRVPSSIVVMEVAG